MTPPAGHPEPATELARSYRHQLRTPVHHILGCSDLLLEELDEHGLAALRPALEQVRAAGQRVQALVDRVAGRPGPDPATAQALIDLLQGIVQQTTALYPAGGEALAEDLAAIEAAARALLALVGPDGTPDPNGAEAVDHATPEPDGPAADLGCLLVVDDNPVNRRTLGRRLERLGYRVLQAEHGRQALEVLAESPVDLVLLDILMPELDGYGVLERRRADPNLRGIPVIMLSAADDAASVIRCVKLGAEDYLSKPFDPILLQARIGACLEKKRLHDQEKALLATIQTQATELAELNRTLEARVQAQVEELERVGRLRRFLAPQLAELIVSGGDEAFLASHRRQVTVLFCDLRGFTAFAESAEPEEVMGVLREYQTALGELIHQFEGTLERFAGDGMMVFFNDPVAQPDHPERAVRLALAMRERVAELARGWRKLGFELGFGAGLAGGYATLGKVGFEGRFDYAAIGSVTNLAARLCSEAGDGQILVNVRVAAAVEGIAELEPIGDLSLKGFSRPVPASNVVGSRPPT